MALRLAIYIALNLVGVFLLYSNVNTSEVYAKQSDIIYSNYNQSAASVKSTGQVVRVASGTQSVDIREAVLEKYFEGSPLAGTADLFIEACDYYGAPHDCTTVAAIARHETDLCRYHTSAQTYNCWGFGGPGIYRWKFESFEQGINTVTDVLVNQYGIRYMIDTRLMEGTFCGPQDECIGWGNRVNSIMYEINALAVKMGYPELFSLR